MGVTGLWRLIEPAGKPVPVETLENKVLAVDISIWLHQMVKGYQDAKGAPLPNAHLMGLFQRLCKLLYFRIKPVFVFDGGFPDLKRETIAKRQDNKSKYNSQSEKLKREIALLLGKKTAVGALLGKQISPKKNKQIESNDDIFKLPVLPEMEVESESESDEEHSSSASSIDLHSVDLESDKFKNMPLKEKYDLLMELKETRKMNSWGKINTLPKKSDNFSDFQMQRLLKRRKLQECLEETEKEMGDGCMSLNELESLLNEEGIDTKIESLPSRRIASNDSTRYLLISNVKQALADAKKRENEVAMQKVIKEAEISNENEVKENNNTTKSPKHDELEDDLQKAIKMSLECMDETETSPSTSKANDSWTSCFTDSDYSDDDGFEPPDMSSAKAYIMQYCDFTHQAIDNIVTVKQKEKLKLKESKVNKIIEELNQEKTIIEDNINLLSSDDEGAQDDVKLESKAESKDVEEEIENFDVDNTTQASVICIGSPADEIISLDTSVDDVPNIIQTDTKSAPDEEELSKGSSSSEDEFEEVSDNDQKCKPGIELTLNMGSKIEDDIFADVFDQKIDETKTADLSDEMTIDKISKDTQIMAKNNKITEKNSLEEVKANDKIGYATEKKVIEKAKDIKDIEVISNVEKVENININESPIVHETKETNPENITKEIEKSHFKKPDPPKRVEISEEKLQSMATEIEVEENELLQEKGRLDRIGRNITEQMTKEAQELLQVFGIPYIIAPMEAEAQCAFLESVKLTDGTITDDSDIWLFGGKTVYKNFFNQKKHVLQFLSERIERSFNLSREQLVLLALLVGSDYTTGVPGVGPVTALEILASFPLNKKKLLNENVNKQALYQEIVTGLQEFKKWVKAGRRTDNVSLKKKLKNVTLTDDFPSVRVVQAYLEPNVEKSEDKFTWGEIDITILRDYTKSKFGWSQHKLDEIIKPVLKRLLDRKTQRTVHDYFKRKIDFHSLEDQMSKRVKAAVHKMGPETLPEATADSEVPAKKKRKPGTSNVKNKKKKNEVSLINEVVKSSPVNVTVDNKVDIVVPKTDRVQEIIPQREKDKQHLLENKLKAIEVFRKTKIDRKKKATKRRLPVPKEKAELSESDSD